MSQEESNNNVQLPLKLGLVTIISLGTIEYKRPEFHNKNNIFPIGFKSERHYASYMNDSNERTVYVCEIIDRGENQGKDLAFKVTASDDPNSSFISNTASGAWTPIIKLVDEKKSKRSTFTISGVEYFGLAKVKDLIEKLPNANKCHNYRFKGELKSSDNDDINTTQYSNERRSRRKQNFSENHETEEEIIKTPTKPRTAKLSSRKTAKRIRKRSTSMHRLCNVCMKYDTSDGPDNILLQCGKCENAIHTGCHVPSLSNMPKQFMSTWNCDDCKICEICMKDEKDDMLLICETCDRGFHTFCLPVPLDSIPDGIWNCHD
jgi:hypothetical protein